MNGKLILRLFLYLIFRFLHLLLLLESDIYALLLRLFDKKNQEDEVEIFNIFGRFVLKMLWILGPTTKTADFEISNFKTIFFGTLSPVAKTPRLL